MPPAASSLRALIPALLALCLGAGAGAAGAPLVRADEAWVRGTVEGQSGSGAYLRLTSREDLQLVGASSPVAERVEIHEMRVVNEMMTMRKLDRLALPANQSVALEHDRHVMLIGLRQQLTAGQSVALRLEVIDAQGRHQFVDLSVPVRALNAPAPAAGHLP